MTRAEDATRVSALRHFGIPADAETVWRLLLAEPNTTRRELGAQSQLSDDRLDGVIDLLVEANLVRRSSGPAGVTVVDPALALETHLARHERKVALQAEEMATLRSQIPDLASQYARGQASAGIQPGFEIVLGLEDVRRQLYLAAEQVRHETRDLDHAPAAAGLRHAREEADLEILGRGVRQRSIFAARALTQSDVFSELKILHDLGNEIRTLPDVPTRMIIEDRDLVVVPIDPDDMSVGAIFIRNKSVVEAFIYMFDRLWAEADPLFNESTSEMLSDRAARVLELMAIGTKDERIARSLGVGTRTVRREVAELRATLGVHSRAEITAAAVRKGWLSQE